MGQRLLYGMLVLCFGGLARSRLCRRQSGCSNTRELNTGHARVQQRWSNSNFREDGRVPGLARAYLGVVTFGLPPNPVNSHQPEGAHMRLELGDCGGDMRSKEYLDTAQTLLRAAQTMSDRSIACQLKALAEDYERRAEKAARADAAKTLARSAT
jgi:hypothetical protein